MFSNRIGTFLRITILMLMFSVFSVPVNAASLKSGSSGRDVKILQMNLNGLGYAKITTDGIYGTDTLAAVRIYQSSNSLLADGIAGERTLSKIDSTVKPLQADLQKLGFTTYYADGIYGSNTESAVKRFQSTYGLVADGIAGYRTLSKIEAVKANTASSVIVSTSYNQTPSKVVTYSLKRDGNKYITKNFQVKEFKCNDGSDTILIDHKLAALLQNIRDRFGSTVVINSAYRTKSHNAAEGGNSRSLHLTGQAADIKVNGVSPLTVARYAESIGVKGIGRYSTFVHVDTRANRYFWCTLNGSTSAISTFK